MKIEELENHFKVLIKDLGCSLYDYQWISAKSRVLRVFINKKEGGPSLEDCEKVSRKLSDWLDERNVFSQPYSLEVSTPGVERVLRFAWHFEDSVGNNIRVKTKKVHSDSRKKDFVGELKEFKEGNLVLDVKGRLVTIPQEFVSKAWVVFSEIKK